MSSVLMFIDVSYSFLNEQKSSSVISSENSLSVHIPVVGQGEVLSVELDCFTEGKVGMMDAAGNLVIPMCFDNISSFSEGIALVQVNDNVSPELDYTPSDSIKWGFINVRGEFVIPPSLDFRQVSKEYFYFSEGLVPIRSGQDGEFGYTDTSGEFVIEPQFKLAKSFTEGLAAVYIDGKGYGYINRVGDMIIKPMFRSAGLFKDGVAIVQVEASNNDYPHQLAYALIDHQGNYLAPPEIDMIYGQEANNHNNIIERDRGYGTFGQDNLLRVRVPITVIEDDNTPIPSNLAPLGIKGSLGWGKWGYIRKTGGYAISPQYWEASSFYDGYAVVEIAPHDPSYPETLWDRRVLIDTEGRIVARWNPPSLIREQENASNISSEEVIATEHSFLDPLRRNHYLNSSPDRRFLFSADITLFSNGKKSYGFPGADYFHYGLSVAAYNTANSTANSKLGYINAQGIFVIEPQFDEASQFFANGTAVVGIQAEDEQMLWGMINYTGHYLIEPQSKRIFICDNGLIGLYDWQQGERQENIVLLQPTTLAPLPYYATSFYPEDTNNVPPYPRLTFEALQSSSFGIEGLIPVSGKVPDDWHL